MFFKKMIALWALLLALSSLSCKEKEPAAPIVEEEEPPEISVMDVTVPEGNEQWFAQVEVRLTGARKEAVTLSYQTEDGTAQAEWDYVPAWGSLDFPAGTNDTVQAIEIKIYGNKIPEEDEHFEVRFFDIKNAEPQELTATVTLLNDDEPHDTFPGYTTPLEYDGMTLVWNDEFDIAFYQSNWAHATGDGCPNLCGWGNSQLQYYRPENTVVDNGLLTITAREESYGGRAYTSSRILSKDRFEFRYGRVDIRARLPQGKGVWPALWMLGANRDEAGWPECGEIDIMELKGSIPGRVCGTLHYAGAGGSHQNSGAQCSVLSGGASFSDEFHVFSIVWDEESISWFVDGRRFNYEAFDALNLGGQPNPFLEEFYFLINVAVGGHYDGDPDDTTVFPQKMEVDYIRVFQKE